MPGEKSSSISMVMDQIIQASCGGSASAVDTKEKYRLTDDDLASTETQAKKRFKQTAHSAHSNSTPTEDPRPIISTYTQTKNGERLLQEAEMKLASSSYRPKVLLLSTNSSSSSSSKSSSIVTAVKTASLSLEKAITKNQLLRGQHADDPSLFMESELNLHDEITALQAFAALEEDDVEEGGNENDMNLLSTCYTALIDVGTLASLVSLIISHENVDISMAVIQLMVELIDPALITNQSRSTQIAMGKLALTFIQLGGLDGMIQNISRLQSSPDGSSATSIQDIEEEGQVFEGIDTILSFMENLLEIDQMGILQISYTLMMKEEQQLEKEDSHGHVLNTTFNNFTFHSIVQYICEKAMGFISFLLLLMMDDPPYDNYSFASLSLNIPSTVRVHVSEVLATIFQHDDFNTHILDLSTLPTLSSSSILSVRSSATNTMSNSNGTIITTKESILMIDGVEVLLLIIAKYRKKDPDTEEECECLENIMDCLATCLLDSKNVLLFLQREGLELMLRCIREKVHSGGGAIKVIDFALSGTLNNSKITDHNPWDTFISVGGLKTLFPLFMGKGHAIPIPASCTDAGNIQLQKKFFTTPKEISLQKRVKRAMREKRDWILSIESHSIHILYSLFIHLDEHSPHDAKNRLMSKFLEQEYEKCDRLVELCLKYDGRMQQAEYHFYRSKETEVLENMGRQEELELLAMKAKLNGGGELYYKLCVITAFVAVGSKRCHEHILSQLKTQNYNMGIIKSAIHEYLGILDSERSAILMNFQLLDKI